MSVGASRWIDRTIDRITRQTDSLVNRSFALLTVSCSVYQTLQEQITCLLTMGMVIILIQSVSILICLLALN